MEFKVFTRNTKVQCQQVHGSKKSQIQKKPTVHIFKGKNITIVKT